MDILEYLVYMINKLCENSKVKVRTGKTLFKLFEIKGGVRGLYNLRICTPERLTIGNAGNK